MKEILPNAREKMKILGVINPENVSEEFAKKLKPRLAARGVVLDADNNVAVLPVSNHNFYKLPGGGIEEGESEIDGFRRECVEEIGYDVEVLSGLGVTIEYRAAQSGIQTSHCYVGRVIGEKQKTVLSENEISQGLKEPIWVPFEEGFKLVSTSNPDNYSGKFIKERDTIIIEAARRSLR